MARGEPDERTRLPIRLGRSEDEPRPDDLEETPLAEPPMISGGCCGACSGCPCACLYYAAGQQPAA